MNSFACAIFKGCGVNLAQKKSGKRKCDVGDLTAVFLPVECGHIVRYYKVYLM